MKAPIYEPEKMSDRKFAAAYGKAWMRYDKLKQKQQIELNRNQLIIGEKVNM